MFCMLWTCCTKSFCIKNVFVAFWIKVLDKTLWTIPGCHCHVCFFFADASWVCPLYITLHKTIIVPHLCVMSWWFRVLGCARSQHPSSQSHTEQPQYPLTGGGRLKKEAPENGKENISEIYWCYWTIHAAFTDKIVRSIWYIRMLRASHSSCTCMPCQCTSMYLGIHENLKNRCCLGRVLLVLCAEWFPASCA